MQAEYSAFVSPCRKGAVTVETSVTFPGLTAIVPSARRFVRGIMAGSPRVGDMELITAELASNAIRHTPSGQDGGEFALTVRTEPGWARVEVTDAGTGEWSAPRGGSDDDEYGRGLPSSPRSRTSSGTISGPMVRRSGLRPSGRGRES